MTPALSEKARLVATSLTGGRATWLAWAVVRLLGLGLLTGNAGYPQVDISIFEYHQWAHFLFAGHLPWRDFPVEYPPGVFPAMLLPGGTFGYELEFIVAAMVFDAITFGMLLRRGRTLGAWFWCLIPVAIGPIVWVRFDIFLAALLVAFVLFVSEHRWRAAAWCVAGATVLKLWPIALVAVGWYYLPRTIGRRFLTWAAAAIAAPILAVIAIGGAHGLWVMMTFQGGRGLEVESLWAVPYAVAHSLLHGPWPVPAHGSGEYPVAGWRAVAISAALPVAVALLAVAWRRRVRSGTPPRPAAVVLAVVAVVLLTAKVLSAQYILWAVAAVTVLVDELPNDRRRRLVVVTTLFAATTQFLFPLSWWHLLFNDTRGVIATVLHGELLVLWGIVALRTCFAADPPTVTNEVISAPDDAVVSLVG